MLMIIITVMINMPFTAINADAATLSGLTVDGLEASADTKGQWTCNGNSIQGSATGTGGCSASAVTSQLTLSNTKGADAQLAFDYSAVLNDGTVKINDIDVTQNGSFKETIASGGTVSIIINTAKDEKTTNVYLNNITLTADRNVTTTFLPAENGSFTVDAQSVTNTPYSNTQNSLTPYHLKAEPDSGYKLLGWYNITTNKPISTDTELDFYIDEDNQSIAPKFTNSENAVFSVGNNPFTDLNEADQYATSSGIHLIVLTGNGRINTSATISNQNTLLIPFDDLNTVYKETPEVIYGSHADPSAFRTLTMASGAHITVEDGGSISVPSKLCASGQNSTSWNGTPTGKHGRIHMDNGSSITLNSGAGLYVYGYISGSGSVYAGAGSTIYECFQIRCWRGGTATSDMAGNPQKVFPLNQYYVQNIEAPLTLASGATEKVYTAVNMMSEAYVASATFIGNGGMFTPSGTVTKRYEGSSDRLILDVDGDFSIKPMSLRITGLPLIGTLDLNTTEYVLPINSNITINVNSGTSTLNQDVAFLPGSKMNIAQGAAVTLAGGHKAYVYDKDQWGAYAAAGAQLVPVGYSTVNGTTAKRNTNSLTDAEIDVNGTMNLIGSLYTTESGAAIISSNGTGKVVFENAAGTEETTYQATQSGSDMSYVSIPVTSAKLRNGTPYQGTEEEYTETAEKAAGTEFNYLNDKWTNADTVTITYDANAGTDPVTGEMSEQTAEKNQETRLNKNTFERTGYTFKGWSTSADSTEVIYTDEQEGIVFDQDTTLYAVWEPVLCKVTWVDEDGVTVLYEDEAVPYGTAPEYKGEEPSKVDEDGKIYQFTGWDPQIETVTGDTVLKATYTVKTCTVTWKNYEGTVLATDDNVACGTAPEYTGDVPVKNLGDGKTYVFTGWDPEVTVVTEDTVYTAVFEEEARTYTVTWIGADGTILEKDENVEENTHPSYDGQTPSKESDVQYNYSFIGWDPEITEDTVVTEDVEYTAVFEGQAREYTVTWKNYDGTELHTDTFRYGEKPSYSGQDPVKEGNAQYSYIFDGWEPEITENTIVTGDTEYTAVFRQETNKYTVTWLNDDGSELLVMEVAYGETPEYGLNAPTKKGDAQYSYTFAGWDKEIVPVTEDVTYTALYDQTVNTYTVKWVNYDGEELETDENVPYGTVPVYDGERPEKPSTEQNTYSFIGWDPSVEAVSGDVTYKAVFEENIRTYTVTWVNYNDEVLANDEIKYGQKPVYTGEIPVHERTEEFSYVFAGWEPEIADDTVVTADATYRAVFTEVTNTYTVYWLNDDGAVLETDIDVPYGQMPEYNGEEPEKNSSDKYDYSFAGWNAALSEVTGDVEYRAVYNETLRKYTVTWTNEGRYIKEEQVEYGTVPVYSGEIPAKEADAQYTYTFTGWDPEPAEVTGNATYDAVYEPVIRSYTITWLNANGEIFAQKDYEFGTTPVHPDEIPELTADEHYIYIFREWEPELTEVTGEMTYTAVYDKKGEEHTVTFDANGGSGEMADQIFEYGRLEQLAQNIFTREDGKFNGWNTEPDGSGQSYNDNEPIEYLTEDLVLYAQWKKIGWDTDENGRTWYNEDGDRIYYNSWATIDGKEYFFKPDGYVATDLYRTGSEDGSHEAIFVFDHETGEFLRDQNGLYDVGEDTYWTKDGEVVEYAGLIRTVKDDGEVNYYYFGEDNKAVKNVPEGGQDQWIPKEKTNGLLPEWGYYIDENGVLLHDPDTSKNGILEEDGGKYYYIDGIRVHMGLFKIGDDYYYAKSKGELICGRSYYCSRMNEFEDEFPEGPYTFDEEGRMIRPDTTKNGIYEEDGSLYYYENGVRTYGGIMLIDGYYYYAATSGEVVHGRKYWISKTNDLLPEKSYEFDDQGRIVFPPEPKNGIYEEDGSLYYYENNVRTYGGVMLIDGDYYYAATSGEIVHGRKYWISKTNGLLEEKSYEFADDGKIIFPSAAKNGIYEEDGSFYYYENGVRTYGGVMEIDGDYYYAASSGEIVHGRKYWISKTNGLIPERSYTFDNQGRITDAPEKKDDTVSGIVEEDGSLYYYENGLRTYGGVMLIDGNYYYAATSGEVVHGKKYWISKTNGLLKEKSYTFDDNGVITDPVVIQ